MIIMITACISGTNKHGTIMASCINLHSLGISCKVFSDTRYNVQCMVVTHIIPNLTVQLLRWIVVEQTLVLNHNMMIVIGCNLRYLYMYGVTPIPYKQAYLEGQQIR